MTAKAPHRGLGQWGQLLPHSHGDKLVPARQLAGRCHGRDSPHAGAEPGRGLGHSFTPTLADSALTFGSSSVTTSIDNNEIGFTADPGLYTGEAVVYNNNGGASIGGLDDGQTYYVISVDDTHIQLAQSLDDAISGNAITLTAPGTGSFTLPAPTSNVMAYINSSTVTAGGQVLVRSGFDDPDLTAPTDPAPASTLTINPQTSVSLTDNAIHFSSPDGFKTGDQVVYHNGGGTSIGGLTDGQTYYAIVADPSTIKLASTYANAVRRSRCRSNFLRRETVRVRRSRPWMKPKASPSTRQTQP